MSATLSSSIHTEPEVGSTIRFTMRSRVVLPQPDEPTRTVVCPLGACKLKSRTASVPSGYDLLTLSKRIIAPT